MKVQKGIIQSVAIGSALHRTVVYKCVSGKIGRTALAEYIYPVSQLEQ